LVLVEGVKDGGPDVVLPPPLILYDENRDYSKEIRSLLSP
jgi:tRNA1(Val) A37 N6-methylase TrmN6